MGPPDPSGGVEREAAGREQNRDPRVFAQLADAYRKEGLLDEAIQICRRGLAAQPAYVNGRLILAQALLDRGALKEAEAESRRVLEHTRDNLLALRILGDISAKGGRAEEARGYYLRALRTHPNDGETQGRLAALPMMQEASGRGEAVQEYRGDRDPLASPTLAALYASQGHTDVAEAIYSQLGRRPGGAAPLSTRGDIPGQGTPASSLLTRLLALREAARRVREARTQARPDARHDR